MTAFGSILVSGVHVRRTLSTHLWWRKEFRVMSTVMLEASVLPLEDLVALTSLTVVKSHSVAMLQSHVSLLITPSVLAAEDCTTVFHNTHQCVRNPGRSDAHRRAHDRKSWRRGSGCVRIKWHGKELIRFPTDY